MPSKVHKTYKYTKEKLKNLTALAKGLPNSPRLKKVKSSRISKKALKEMELSSEQAKPSNTDPIPKKVYYPSPH